MMKDQAKENKFTRLASRLKRAQISSPTTATTSSEGNPHPQTLNDDYSDRDMTLKKYKTAVDQLKKAIEIRKGPWNSFDFEKLSDEPDHLDDLQFRNKINAVVISWEPSINDRKGWSKFTYAVECVFTALSPLVKNLLMASQGAQSVIASSLFDSHFNPCVDTFAESIWHNMQRSLSLNNGSPVVSQNSDRRLQMKRLRGKEK